MSTMSAKNMAISPAAYDLGLGTDLLTQQLLDADQERKKKLQAKPPGEFGDSTVGAAAALFGGIGTGNG